MPWRYPDKIPKVAKNWTESQQKRCISAGNSVLKRGGTDAEAIRACIAAAGKSSRQKKSSLALAAARQPLSLQPLPFIAAIESARRRKIVLPEVYYGELQGLARSLAFTVSRLSTLDQIDRVLKAVNRSLEEGNTFADFKREVDADPDVLNLPRGRVETVFRNGVQTAYARGRAEQFVRHKQTRPYLLYSAINDSRVRPAHLAMDGTLLPIDHPWWSQNLPPNGHRCRCSALAVTREEAERRGVTVEPPNVKADPGWDHSVMDDPALGVIEAAANKRLRINPALASLVPESIPRRLTLDEISTQGLEIAERLYQRLPELSAGAQASVALLNAYQAALARELVDAGRSTAKVARIRGRGQGPDLVREASSRFPDTWTDRADELGDLRVKFAAGRAWQFTLSPDIPSARVALAQPFGRVEATGGAGFIVADNLNTAVHEYAHRLQAALPELDDYFQELHARRTAGDILESLRALTGRNYRPEEVTRKDKYVNEYMGREYRPDPYMYTGRAGALEVMSMAFEAVLGLNPMAFYALRRDDPELFELTLGVLFHYDP